MVLIQLYITQDNNNSYIDVPLYGIYDVNMVGLQYYQAGSQHAVLQIQSDILRFQSSSRPNLLFMNKPDSNINYSAALETMPSIKNADFNGKIYISVSKVAGHNLSSFYLLLTFEATCSPK